MSLQKLLSLHKGMQVGVGVQSYKTDTGVGICSSSLSYAHYVPYMDCGLLGTLHLSCVSESR